MFCNKTTDRPQRNILLENMFLWKPYAMRYGGNSTERFETIFNGPNLSDIIHRIENRRTHIQALQITLKSSLLNIRDPEFLFDQTKTYLTEADYLNEKLETFIQQLKSCERKIKSQSITFRNLVNNYRSILRDSQWLKPSKQEAAAFIVLCEKLSALDQQSIEFIKTTDEQKIITDINLITKYQANKFKNLVIKESTAFIDDEILTDIRFRRNLLQEKQKYIAELYLIAANHPFHVYYTEQHQYATQMINSLDEYEKKFIQFRDIYNEIDNIMFEYRDELSKRTLHNTIDGNTILPTYEQMSTFECSRLILISELLRSETDRIEVETVFPQITKLINNWKQNTDIDPKIYDLFATLEQDLLSLYDRNNSLMNLIPFRVGFIGNISVGKSSLVNYLRTQNSVSNSIKRTFSPTAVGQSTVGSLQFDEQHQCSDNQTIITIRYVDIEGCTDYNTKVQAASYFEQIQKADCDLYIILFTGQQGSFECKLQKEINERLHRPCWFVRSKVDREFDEHFNEQIARRKIDYPDMDMDKDEENELVEHIIEMIREKSIEISQTSPENVFLVNSMYHQTEENTEEKFTSKTYPFDINLLSRRLIDMAQKNYRQERIQRMATMVCARAIGTCFRQRCIISFISHQLRASISAMVLPWGDQLSLIHTRFGIRVALGVQDRPTLYNRVMNKTDIFQILLLKYPLNIDPNDLKSDEFSYLKTTDPSLTTTINTGNIKNEYSKTIYLGRELQTAPTITQRLSSAMPAGAVAAGVVGNKLAAATLAVSTLSYGIGVGFFGIGIAAAIPIGLWTLKKSSKQICDYLDTLCSDLLIISEHFIFAIINQQINNEGEE